MYTKKPNLYISQLANLHLMNLESVIQACKKQNRKAQKELYDAYAPKFLSICHRYMKNLHDAEDALLEAFYNIFKKLDQFKGDGSFEGWMKRVVVNQCLMKLRKRTNFHLSIETDEIDIPLKSASVQDLLEYEEVIALLHQLAPGYRTVFNLYVIEGFKHREIAEILGISINTSKSQLILAKKKMQLLIKKKDIVRYA